jgi:hypothetical protein
MSTATAPNVSELVSQCIQSAEGSKAQLLSTFEFVPEDKLTWSPPGSARSAINIVAHCGLANQAFATVLRGEPLEIPEDRASARERIRNAGSEMTDRAEAVRLLESSTAEIVDALKNVKADQIESMPDSPFGPIPFTFWMQLSGLHMSGHARQIDYLQTIWGDLDEHMPSRD